MRRLRGRHQAGHDEARAKQRHVEALAVERHQHRGAGDALADAFEHRGLLAEGPDEKLLEDERRPGAHALATIPPREPHQERDRPGASGEPRGLGVEKERARGIAPGE